MDKLKIQFTNEALNNLVQITQFYEDKQPGLGSRFVNYIQSKLEILEIHPNIGRIGKVFGTRELILDEFPYICVYRVRKTFIQLLLVYHQSRKYPN